MESLEAWAKVPVNRNTPCALSPAYPGPRWRGILINAPELVTFRPGFPADRFGAFAVIPICGFSFLEIRPSLVGVPLVVVAKDVASGQVFEGPLVPVTDGMEAPPPPPTPGFADSIRRGYAAGGYFNPNIANLLPLPSRAAQYEVVVRYGEAASNRVLIRVVAEREQ